MKLIVKRDQDKALMGGMSFLLSCRVEVTNEERDLIKKYKAHKTALAHRTTKSGVEAGTIKIGNLIDGVTFRNKDISALLESEEVVKEACASFKTYLDVMASFGGEEVIEFT